MTRMHQVDWKKLRRAQVEVSAGHANRAKETVRSIVPQLEAAVDDGERTALVHLAWAYRFLGTRGKKTRIARLYDEAAAAGNPIGMLEVGYRLVRQGKYSRGAKLVRRAAKLGNTEAAVLLAQLHLRGQGVKNDPAKAERLLLHAHRRGSARAELWLGWKRDFFDVGRWKEAARWYRLAAEKGEAAAMFNFAVCLERGLGIRGSEAGALRWFKRAAAAGDSDARAALRRLGAHSKKRP